MDTQLLTIFLEVAKQGSFAAAARRGDRDPSYVSRSIANLEQQLNVQLFKRSTRRLSLTESGQRYLARVGPIMEELYLAEEEARQLTKTPSGLIRLTASTAFGELCLMPLMPAFYRQYPDISLDLRLSDSNVDLFADDVDLACRLSPSFQSDLIGVKLFDTCYRICASPAYLQGSRTLVEPTDLAQHHCVVFSLPHYRSRWLFRNKGADIDEVKIKTRFSVSNALALKQALLRGIGPGLAPNWLVDDEIQKGKLVNLFPKHQVTATDFSTGAWLLYPSRKYMPLKTRVMIDYLKQQFREA